MFPFKLEHYLVEVTLYEITFYFVSDQLHNFQEAWHLNVASAAVAVQKGRIIATQRINILANSIRLVGIQVPGEPYVQLHLRGRGGDGYRPQEMLNLRNDGYSTGKRVRGVPREIFGKDGLTVLGIRPFRDFTRVLAENGGVIVRAGKNAQPINDLQPSRGSPLLARMAKPATRKKLVALLGEEEGLQVWTGRPREPAVAT